MLPVEHSAVYGPAARVNDYAGYGKMVRLVDDSGYTLSEAGEDVSAEDAYVSCEKACECHLGMCYATPGYLTGSPAMCAHSMWYVEGSLVVTSRGMG